jgi:hypothetical protein
VRGSTVDGVMGWPAGGADRGGPVVGTGGGAGAGGDIEPGNDPGRPVRGSICGWLLPDSPVLESIVDRAPTGGDGVSVGDVVPGVPGVDGAPGGGEAAPVPVWASAGAAVSSTTPRVSAAVRA